MSTQEEAIGELRAALADAKDEIRHLKANHEHMILRCALLRQSPDLPVDRISAYDKLIQLQEENKRLRAELANRGWTIADYMKSSFGSKAANQKDLHA